MNFIIKIRWNCGTERYVTGYAGRNEVSWNLGEPAYAFSTYEEARGIMLGLNINHLSSDLGGFACVVVVASTRPICANPTLTEFSIPVPTTPPVVATVTFESGVK